MHDADGRLGRQASTYEAELIQLTQHRERVARRAAGRVERAAVLDRHCLLEDVPRRANVRRWAKHIGRHVDAAQVGHPREIAARDAQLEHGKACGAVHALVAVAPAIANKHIRPRLREELVDGARRAAHVGRVRERQLHAVEHMRLAARQLRRLHELRRALHPLLQRLVETHDPVPAARVLGALVEALLLELEPVHALHALKALAPVAVAQVKRQARRVEVVKALTHKVVPALRGRRLARVCAGRRGAPRRRGAPQRARAHDELRPEVEQLARHLAKLRIAELGPCARRNEVVGVLAHIAGRVRRGHGAHSRRMCADIGREHVRVVPDVLEQSPREMRRRAGHRHMEAHEREDKVLGRVAGAHIGRIRVCERGILGSAEQEQTKQAADAARRHVVLAAVRRHKRKKVHEHIEQARHVRRERLRQHEIGERRIAVGALALAPRGVRRPRDKAALLHHDKQRRVARALSDNAPDTPKHPLEQCREAVHAREAHLFVEALLGGRARRHERLGERTNQLVHVCGRQIECHRTQQQRRIDTVRLDLLSNSPHVHGRTRHV